MRRGCLATSLCRCFATFAPPPVVPPRRVVVTGIGLVTPLAVGRELTWQRLLRGDTGVRLLRAEDLSGGAAALEALTVRTAALVPRGTGAGELDVAALDDGGRLAPFTVFALAAAAEALADARWSAVSCPERTGVAIGSGMGHVEEVSDVGALLAAGRPRRVSPYFVPRVLVNMAAGAVSQASGARGPLCAPATACASAAHAIGEAHALIRHGHADVMIAGGSEACVGSTALVGFARARALSTAGAARPFDSARDGFVLAEGAAVVVLEEAGHAAARGARVYAEMRSVGLSADAHHVTAPPPDGRGAAQAMRAALRGGGVEACDVGYVNAHATGTPGGDAAEAAAIRAVFGEHTRVSSTKGATGHLLGAAGALEAAFCILSLAQGVVPHTHGLDAPDVGPLRHVAGQSERVEGLRAAMSNSFGFGGTNACILFTSWPDE